MSTNQVTEADFLKESGNRPGSNLSEACVPITPFNLQGAAADEYTAFSEFRNHISAEELPDDPPVPVNEFITRFRSVPATMVTSVWVAWDTARKDIVASGGLNYFVVGENAHILNFRIAVLPKWRRHGIGRRLLKLIIPVAERENRVLMIGNTNGRVAAGEAFMKRLDASRGLESHTNQLELSKVNQPVLNQWLHSSQERDDFELLFQSGPYAEEHVANIAALHDVINQQPHEKLRMEKVSFTTAHVRAIERRLFATGAQRWSFCLRERATGAFAGFTEVQWHPNRPAIVHQGFTGVFTQFRNRGLGRWLKAAMLKKIISSRPGVKFIRTENADNNAAMLRINHQLGFTAYSTRCVWQVETSRASQYVGSATN